MTELQKQTSSLIGSFSILHAFITKNPVLILKNMLGFWKLIEQLRTKRGYHGMYEVLEYNSTLEIMDPGGKAARLTRHEVIRFLQDNVVAIHDHAWGDGELFANYECQPGVKVDCYPDGSKRNILISLRETKNRGDTINLRIARDIMGGFLEKEEWLETEIDHWMEHLKLSIIFPQERPCRRAAVTQRSTGETTALDGQYFSRLSDGRQILIWEINRPRLHDLYTIKWRW